MSDRVDLVLPDGRRVAGAAVLVSERRRAAGPDCISARFQIPADVWTADYVAVLVKLDTLAVDPPEDDPHGWLAGGDVVVGGDE